MAEWSKAVDLGSIPKGRGFKPHLLHFLYCKILLGISLLSYTVCLIGNFDFKNNKLSFAKHFSLLKLIDYKQNR